MTKTFLKTNLIPIITVILCCILYISGYFQMTIAALLMITASVIEYKKDAFKSLGFERKKLKAKSILLIAPLVAIVFFLFNGYVLLPVITYFTGQPIDYSIFDSYKGNFSAILSLFTYMVLSAAFGEEIVFRGYLMRQFTKFFGSSKISIIMNILLFGVLFGLSHAYQGITGMLLTGIIGVLFAVVFHIRKNDLWFNVALHFFIDTMGLICMYYGWLPSAG